MALPPASKRCARSVLPSVHTVTPRPRSNAPHRWSGLEEMAADRSPRSKGQTRRTENRPPALAMVPPRVVQWKVRLPPTVTARQLVRRRAPRSGAPEPGAGAPEAAGNGAGATATVSPPPPPSVLPAAACPSSSHSSRRRFGEQLWGRQGPLEVHERAPAHNMPVHGTREQAQRSCGLKPAGRRVVHPPESRPNGS